jgi:antirestriction protein ArdC
MSRTDSTATAPTKADTYTIITDRIIALLEQGTVPWHKPWQGGSQMPRNLLSGREYRGVNTFLLHSMCFDSPYWLTFKQAGELGGTVRKGQKACPVVFWKWLDVDDHRKGEQKRVPFLRYYSVFNVAQCDGLEGVVPQPETPLKDHSAIATAESVVDGMPQRPEIRLGQGRAFYAPAPDYVGIPDRGTFDTAEDYYSVLFHELTHATGHHSRLARKQLNEWESFGSQSYSKEELIAEMGAAFLCGHTGIVERTIDNSASYIHSWLSRLKSDSKLVVQAAAQAQRAADFILAKRPGEAE